MNRRSCQAVMPLAPGTLSAIIRTSPLGEREIIGTNDRSADSAYRRDFSARDVDGTDLAAEGLRNVEAAVGSDAHPVGAEQSTWRGEAAGGPSLGGANGRFGAEAVRLSCHNAAILPMCIQLRRSSAPS